MNKYVTLIACLLLSISFISCSDSKITNSDEVLESVALNVNNSSRGETATSIASAGGTLFANGWYEAEEIYYVAGGVEEGITERAGNEIYLIGGDRQFQANVVLFIPDEPGYTPHWNVNVVHTAEGATLADILASPFASEHYPEALFDDVEDILEAEAAGLVSMERPGVVVLCPIVSESAADAPGNTLLSEEFPPFPSTF